ncbi:hypothetical protein V4F45_000598 [Vibrio parahaemolyticus]|nr:hypothetical protein [Vibrio parahaemolyticus]
MTFLKILFVSTVLIMSGCGGDSGDKPKEDVTGPAISNDIVAMDFSILSISSNSSVPKVLDINDYVSSSEKQSLILSNVVTLSDSNVCQIHDIEKDKLKFSFIANQYGECIFRYTVQIDNSSSKSAIARVLVSPSNKSERFGLVPIGNQLTDINRTASLGSSVDFNLASAPEVETEISSMIHPLFSETTITYGYGIALLDENGNFSFAASAVGTTEINYYIIDDKNTETNVFDDEVYIGRVIISVSGSTNAPPIASDATYLSPLAYGDTLEIDVANFPDSGSLVSDTDGDPIQLVEVHGDGVFLELSNPEDVTNTSFRVRIPSPREESYQTRTIYYTVYDHNEDGVAHGAIQIYVGNIVSNIRIFPEEDPYWDSDRLSMSVFTNRNLGAIGTYEDGSQLPMTPNVLWHSSDPAIASIDTNGVISALTEGTTFLTATYTNLEGESLISNEITLKVTEPDYPITWGSSSGGGDSSGVQTDLVDITEVFSNLYSFAALKGDGTVVTWGSSSQGGNSASVQSKLVNVSSIYHTNSAFAALKADGTVVTWGDSENGGDSSSVASSLNSVTTIVGTGGAFAALRNDGTVVAWGNPDRGGDTGSLTSANLSNVESLYAYYNGSFFAAFKTDGSVITWGNPGKCGDSTGLDLTNVKSVTANAGSCAFLKNDGTVVTNGDSSGPDEELTDVKEIFAANNSGFAALKNDGTVVSWAIENSEVASTLSSVETIVASIRAFVALKSDGTAVAWGSASSGGDSTGVDLTNVKEVIPVANAFTALKNDGTAVSWGSAMDSIGVDLIDIEQVVAHPQGSAFSAIKTDKSVISWGNAAAGGDNTAVESDLFGIERLFSARSAFCALKY